jgi:O-antigen/teichoic acid export membrane protein
MPSEPSPWAPDSTLGEEADEGVALTRSQSLTPILRRGAMISAGALGFSQLVTFVQTLALARILSPHEVGIFYSGTVLLTFLVTFSEGGLRNALVHRKQGLEQAANTVFWASLWAGTLWAVLALAAAPLIGLIFNSSTAGLVAAVTAGCIILHAFTNVPDALLQRRFDFRQRMLVQPSVVLTFAAGSVILCWLGMGVWGLVIASYLSLVVWIAVTWTLAGWWPRRGRASVKVWREMARYGFPLLIGGAGDRGKEVFETVVVGSVFNAAAVGNYRYGRRLGMLPGIVIIELGSYVLFPAFSRTANDPARFKSAFLRALRALWLAAAPTAGMIVIFGVPVTILLLGRQWRDAGLMFASLAGFGLGVALAAVGLEAIKGHGRTSLLNWVNGTGIVVGVASLLALVQFGPVGIGLSLSISAFLCGLLGLLLARKLVGVAMSELAEPLIPPLVAAAAAAVLWGLVEHLVVHSEQRGVVWGLAALVCEGLGFLVTYGAVLLVIAPVTRARLLGWWSSRRRARWSPASDACAPHAHTSEHPPRRRPAAHARRTGRRSRAASSHRRSR